ncbi:hypothetical protein, conserved [Eimeria praecox]|uniref:Uncharacterized protein n=1 Tax=Eimeria praecox TaxID=51316 RepID=U6G7E5_9EIME|nr:hypothetical protein, conserved [Eimeria praecox]
MHRPDKTADFKRSYSRILTGNNFAEVASIHQPVPRGRSSFITIPALKGALCVPGSSSTIVKYHAKLPSFRAIIRQLQEDYQRRLLSELSVVAREGQGTEAVAGMHPASADSTITCARSSSSGAKDDLNTRSGTGSIGFGSSSSIGCSTDSLYHKLARERLKRSFTRLASRMRTSVSHGQMEESETDVPLKADNLDPAIDDLRKQTISVLKELEEGAHLLHKEMRNLQRAAEIAEKMQSQLKPESAADDSEGRSLKQSSGLQNRLSIGILELFVPEVVEPHAAMTDTQLQEIQKAAEGARGQRRLQMEALNRLQEHLSTACECQEELRRAPTSTMCSALNTFDVVADSWSSWAPNTPLLLPVALAALACTTAYDVCTIGSTEVLVQTLASLLFHSGSGKAAEQIAENSFRHSVMHDSMLEHKKLIEDIAVRTLALVLDHDTPTSSLCTSLQLRIPRGEHSPHVPPSAPDVPGNSSVAQATTRACLFSVVSVAQQAILAIHEAGGRRGDPVYLEREAERLREPRIGRNERTVLQKLEFSFLELRLHMNKLLALRLAQSELACTQQAWEKINEFNLRVAALVGQSKRPAEQAD